jgi:REP element-mobilizing transposase RayT
MQAIIPLEHGYTYHIYNRGINGADLFTCEANYKRFLDLFGEHISPIADTYAWVLMRNHFHLLVRIKDVEEIPFYTSNDSAATTTATTVRVKTADRVSDNTLTAVDRPCQRWQQNPSQRWQPNPSRQFSHLFNAYAQYFNKYHGRTGGLFETPFRRVRVNTEKYFRRLVFYIHHNPVKHGFAEHILDWGWSSYLTIISVKPTRLSRETVLGYFDDEANFKAYHQQQHDLRDMENLLLE